MMFELFLVDYLYQINDHCGPLGLFYVLLGRRMQFGRKGFLMRILRTYTVFTVRSNKFIAVYKKSCLRVLQVLHIHWKKRALSSIKKTISDLKLTKIAQRPNVKDSKDSRWSHAYSTAISRPNVLVISRLTCRLFRSRAPSSLRSAAWSFYSY